MDFNDLPEEADYRQKVRTWLSANAEKREKAGETYRGKYGEKANFTRAREWQKMKAEAGFAGITLPEEFGGQAGSQMQQVIYNQEEAEFLVPRGVYEIGLGMCVPTMLTYATAEQKARYAPPALKGEEIWCQLFSEPVAGSDVAGIRTRAEQDGDDWIINGQKIWTSGAHFCDYGIIVTRSDPTVAKHKGLTFFFLDMKSPGIEVRPIKQISGISNFNEVFFTDVRVPDSQRLGAVGDGWRVSITTLMNERLAVGDAPGPDVEDILSLAKSIELEDGPGIENAHVRERIADWYVKAQGLKLTKFRTMTALSRGETPGPEASITKVVSASKLQEIGDLGTDLQDMSGALSNPGDMAMDGIFQQALLWAPGLRIAGGTDEILRNIIAERVLGLPPDIRVDKEAPFNQLPGSQ